MYQSLEQILQEGNDKCYAMDFDTMKNNVSWWIFSRNDKNNAICWHGSEKTIELAKEAMYGQLMRLPREGRHP